MNLWDKKDVPHLGWFCVDMIDLGDDIEESDYETRRHEIYIQCEMCGQEGVRFVHVMEHPEYDSLLHVGCICAAKMENEYAPKMRETELRNRHNRKMNFLRRVWQERANGNLVLKYKGDYITIMRSKYNNSNYGVAYSQNFIWEYKEEKIRDIYTAKLAAFDIFDQGN